jgi:hypothetical protein
MSVVRRGCAGLVVAVALVGAVGTSTSQASPGGQPSPGPIDHASTRALVKPTSDKYVVKLIAKVPADSGDIRVSSNGKWAVTNVGTLGSGDGPTTELVNVAKDSIVGTLSESIAPRIAEGVDDAGIVYGTVDVLGPPDEGYYNDGMIWDGHTISELPGSGAINPNCSATNKETFYNLSFKSVNAAGVAVGSLNGECKTDGTSVGEAISYSPEKNIQVTGTYHDSSDVAHHPGAAVTIDDDNVVSGYEGSPTVLGVYEWVNGISAEPQSVAPQHGVTVVWPSTNNALWQGNDFVGSPTSQDAATDLVLYQTGVGTATHTPIPNTEDVESPGVFDPLALSTKDLVVGTLTEYQTTKTEPALWAVGSAVTPLISLLASPTKDHLLTATGIDTSGDIFGTATTSTAKNAQQYLYEAVVAHPAPSVRLKTPKSGGTYNKGAKLKASYTCTAGKGAKLKSCKGSEPDHHAVSTKKVGKHTFTVVATDTDGEQTKKTVHFTVKK